MMSWTSAEEFLYGDKTGTTSLSSDGYFDYVIIFFVIFQVRTLTHDQAIEMGVEPTMDDGQDVLHPEDKRFMEECLERYIEAK